MNKLIAAIVTVIVMIALIPAIGDDYILVALYAVVIVISLSLYREKRDLIIFALGFCGMTLSEFLFISTGVETFTRNSLFGIMPLWLPFLWGYGFITMRRVIHYVENT